ncbi:type IV pilin protein [Bdellovibrio sp. GT3]|uniref:type IV pilin protein n=1 Tax=Bdellovibrio sp. GT3 TaxID=3136282 RepID=UPI0030F1EC15
MKRTTRTSQAGFSLVELMVVVAIIGVLASIAVPAVNKYIAKARQSEAKTNLASLYTSEKAFFSEYTTYDSRFQAIGYSPEGQLRYNVGFSAAHTIATAAANGFATPVTVAATNTGTFCLGIAVAMPTNGTGPGCKMLAPANGTATISALPATAGTGNTFRAAAAAVIHSSSGAPIDQWTMTDMKVLSNTVNGIP